MVKNWFYVVGVLSMMGGGAIADHNTYPQGSCGSLQAETRELVYSVRSSRLRYYVQSSVYQFASDVDRLADCVRYGRSGGPIGGPIGDRDVIRPIFNDHLGDSGVPSICRFPGNTAGRFLLCLLPLPLFEQL